MEFCPAVRSCRHLPLRAALVAVLAMAMAVIVGSPADATPRQTIPEVTHQLDVLGRQSSALDEQYNVALAAVAQKQQRAQTTARAAAAAAGAAVRAKDSLSVAAAQRYETGTADSTALLLTSDDPQGYIDGLSSMDYLTTEFATLVGQARTTQRRATAVATQATQALAAARAAAAGLAQHRTALAAQTVELKALLARLTEAQRRAYEHARQVAAAKARAELAAAAAAAKARAEQAAAQAVGQAVGQATQNHVTTLVPAVTPSVSGGAVSGDVQRVVDFAEAQVGKSYSYSSSGPDSFDCSGLTMASWAQAGVQLPHQSAGQYDVGRHVSFDELQPGDLIFLYHPISHVEIYVGDDLAVSAADPAIGIVYVHPSQDMGNYVGATRPTG